MLFALVFCVWFWYQNMKSFEGGSGLKDEAIQ